MPQARCPDFYEGSSPGQVGALPPSCGGGPMAGRSTLPPSCGGGSRGSRAGGAAAISWWRPRRPPSRRSPPLPPSPGSRPRLLRSEPAPGRVCWALRRRHGVHGGAGGPQPGQHVSGGQEGHGRAPGPPFLFEGETKQIPARTVGLRWGSVCD